MKSSRQDRRICSSPIIKKRICRNAVFACYINPILRKGGTIQVHHIIVIRQSAIRVLRQVNNAREDNKRRSNVLFRRRRRERFIIFVLRFQRYVQLGGRRNKISVVNMACGSVNSSGCRVRTPRQTREFRILLDNASIG